MDKTTQDPNRVALRLDPETRKRLRLHAAIQGRSVQAVLEDWIAARLPSDDELADAVRGGASREH